MYLSYLFVNEYKLISREITPVNTKKFFIGLRSRASLSISALSGRQGRNTHAYGICTPFYCISLKNIYGGGIMLPGVWFQGTLSNIILKCIKSLIYKTEIMEFIFCLHNNFIIYCLNQHYLVVKPPSLFEADCNDYSHFQIM